MAVEAMTLVGLHVHARQTHTAILDPVSGKLRVSKLRMAPVEATSVLEGLGPGVRAVYEAGPTGFGLARVSRERWVDVRVVAPGSIPKGCGDRVKTDAATRSGSCGCWPPASLASRSCHRSPMSTSAISCVRSRTSAAT